MAALFFLVVLAFSPFLTRCEEDDDAIDWKPFEPFAQYQIRKANNYFSTLNETQKLDLFENWSGADIGKFSTEIDLETNPEGQDSKHGNRNKRQAILDTFLIFANEFANAMRPRPAYGPRPVPPYSPQGVPPPPPPYRPNRPNFYNPSGYDPVNRETAFGMARKKRGIKSFFEKLFLKKLKHVHDGKETELFTKENLNLNKAVLDGQPGFTSSGAIETGTKHSYNHVKYDKPGGVNPPLSHERNLAYSDRYSGEFYLQKFRKSAQFEEKSKIY